MVGLVLFDIRNTLLKDQKDISGYIAESIRNIYGIIVDDFNIDDYEGMTAKETVRKVLQKHGMPEEEINMKIDRITEDLPYCWYNVAGHDKQIPTDGAEALLKELEKKQILAGIATGEIKRIVDMRFEKVNFGKYLKFGEFGNEREEMKDILTDALNRAKISYGFNGGKACFVTNSVEGIRAGRDAGLLTVGVPNGKYSYDELRDAGADAVVKSLKDKGKIIDLLL